MLKRITVIVFFALASILLLVHAVVPHHHHNNQVCFKNSHCQHDDFTDEHNSNSHSHDGENSHDNCVLKEPVVVFSNQWKTDFKFNNIPDCAGLDDFHKNLLYSSSEFRSPVLLTLISELITDSSYPCLVSASLGLRAPPAV
jgi:hypothetical protein